MSIQLNIHWIIKQDVNKCNLSKISEVITKVKEVWSGLDQIKVKYVIVNILIKLSKCIEVKRQWIDY